MSMPDDLLYVLSPAAGWLARSWPGWELNVCCGLAGALVGAQLARMVVRVRSYRRQRNALRQRLGSAH